MDDIGEKRVYADRAGGAELLLAGADGIVAVEVSAGRVGRFGFVRRGAATAIAGADGIVAVVIDGDVRVRGPGAGDFGATGFGPAAAVGVIDGAVYAAAPDGHVARSEAGDGDLEWVTVGEPDADVRAIDPPLLATSAGLYRLPGLDYVGLDDAHDVAAAGPLAATEGGLFSLGNGWMRELDGSFRVAGADGERAHAATTGRFFARLDGDWERVDLPAAAPVVDVAYGRAPYVVTRDGTVLAPGEAGWRATSLGVDGVVGCVLG